MTNNIIEKIKNLRTQTGVSQEDVANYIGVSRLTYMNIESEKREIKEDELKKIADFFEKSLSYFVDINQKKDSNQDKNYKLKQLILYISEKTQDIPSFGKTVLNKLLYFSDFNYYEWASETITGINYKKLPFGPVPENITEILDEMVQEGLIVLKDSTYHKYTQQKIIPLVESDLSFLEEIDKTAEKECAHMIGLPKAIDVINNVLNKFSHFKASEISDWSHKDTPYVCTKNIGDIIRPGLVFYRSETFIVNPNNL